MARNEDSFIHSFIHKNMYVLIFKHMLGLSRGDRSRDSQ